MAEIELSAIRASGPGGQHVNKTSSAIQLRFYIPSSASLNAEQKSKLFAHSDNHISENGMIVIKAQGSRSQHRNKEDALFRLKGIIKAALQPKIKRKPTQPTYGSVKRRLKSKAIRSEKKSLRGKVERDDF
ncbi:ribosome-associated protein [Litorimonas taeanensis]|uniref:Ribosome-associated protein n=2 Tax=Litorimonas taeanensis TaxID=568099 RepID=A0A420WJ72_9PROT|nr:ribosome-associated protein [Litorimonas taeanensis]